MERLGLREQHLFYVPSLSSNTIVYKGMLIADQMETMFPDLSDPAVESALALVHQRFSTNTFPSWPLAHPYRYAAHNGEINTLRGNINWMRAREALCRSDLFGDDLQKLFPLIREGQSDTATFDNVLEFLVLTGRPLAHAVLMMIPEPWSNHEVDEPRAAGFLPLPRLAHGALGRAGVDRLHGRHVDRRRARPQRPAAVALLRDEGRHSDHGVRGRRAGRAARERPGQGAPAPRPHLPGRHRAGPHHRRRGDQGRAWPPEQPYGEWLARETVHLDDLPPAGYSPPPARESVRRRQRAFGYTEEDLRILVGPMGAAGAEPIGSMGTDTALAVLSDRSRLLYDYFKQLFAQVTNPPLDAIREELVTDMGSTLGSERNLLRPEPASCHQIRIDYPILDNDELAKAPRGVGSGLPVGDAVHAVSARGRHRRPRAGHGRRSAGAPARRWRTATA